MVLSLAGVNATATTSMPDYYLYHNILHFLALALWISSHDQFLLPFKVAYIALLMAFFLVA